MKSWGSILLLACLTLVCFTFENAPAEINATISLGRVPEPPTFIDNPGGDITINWSIVCSTSPLLVNMFIRDANGQTVIHEEYFGTDGIEVSNYIWTVPPNTSGGIFRIRVEFYSVEFGNEANAEVTFWVDDEFAETELPTWGKIKSLFEDPVVEA
jgi:hypothetical protein